MLDKILFALADAVPMSVTVESLKEESSKFLANPSVKNTNSLQNACILFLTKLKIEDAGSLQELEKRMDAIRETMDVGAAITGLRENQ